MITQRNIDRLETLLNREPFDWEKGRRIVDEFLGGPKTIPRPTVRVPLNSELEHACIDFIRCHSVPDAKRCIRKIIELAGKRLPILQPIKGA